MSDLTIITTIKQNWWLEEGGEIDAKHQFALEESGMDRIKEMMAEGVTSGELNDHVRIDDSDGEDGVHYRGHWELNTAIEKEPPLPSPVQTTIQQEPVSLSVNDPELIKHAQEYF